MVLVCVAIRDLISPISRVTVSAATAAVLVRVDDSPPTGVAEIGGVDARGDRSALGVYYKRC